jgi:hypothetical protein
MPLKRRLLKSRISSAPWNWYNNSCYPILCKKALSLQGLFAYQRQESNLAEMSFERLGQGVQSVGLRFDIDLQPQLTTTL